LSKSEFEDLLSYYGITGQVAAQVFAEWSGSDSDMTKSELQQLLENQGVPGSIINTVMAQIEGEVSTDLSWPTGSLETVVGNAVTIAKFGNVDADDWTTGLAYYLEQIYHRIGDSNTYLCYIRNNAKALNEGLNLTGYASGGISSGPDTGYLATLHGTEAVVPLPDGQSIPVDLQGINVSGSDSQEITELREQNKLLRQLIETIETKDTAPNITLAMDKKQLKNEIRDEVRERSNRQVM
jgi:hypothetical protein